MSPDKSVNLTENALSFEAPAPSFEWIVGYSSKVRDCGRHRHQWKSCALSARGISIATAKTSVNAGRHRRTYRQEPGHKGALAVRLRKLAIDGEKTLQGVAELAYQQSFQV